ncbi:hypothetical protein [Nostoc sp.]
MKMLDQKDAVNRRQDERLIIVETAIHRLCGSPYKSIRLAL